MVTGLLLTGYLLVIALLKIILQNFMEGMLTGLKAIVVLFFGTAACALVGGVIAFIAGTMAKPKSQ